MSHLSFKTVWRIPFWLGALSMFGLLAALLGTGIWYFIAWITVGLPLAVIIYKVFSQNK